MRAKIIAILTVLAMCLISSTLFAVPLMICGKDIDLKGVYLNWAVCLFVYIIINAKDKTDTQ